MCQAIVYLNDEELMKDVINIRLTPEGLRLETLFETPKIVRATICEIDLLKHRVWLDAASVTDAGEEEE